jgi:hypothetical protein
MTTTTNNRKSFILHSDSLEVLDKLSDEQAGKIFKAIKIYQKTGEIATLDFALEIAFLPFLNQFKRDLENYQKTCEARRLAGSRGGKQKVANASKCKQKVANLADSDSKSDSDSDSDSKSDLSIEEKFESFWNLYGKKLSRPDVEKKFKAALKKDTFENIIAGVERYVKARSPDAQFWKNPSTWLNQECWKDELETTQKNQQEGAKLKPLVDFINKIGKGSLVEKITLNLQEIPVLHFASREAFEALKNLSEIEKSKIKQEIFKTLNKSEFKVHF